MASDPQSTQNWKALFRVPGFPAFFAAMLIPLWRGPRRGIAWVVAGAVALLVQQLSGGWWFIVAGALAGSIAGGFIDDK